MKNNKPLFKRRSMPDLFPAPAAGAAVQSVELSVFADQKSRANTNTGHGEMAEEAITLLDNLLGFDAEVTGRDNLKDGPDRRVGDTYIQTKYYTTARNSMEACFNEKTGLYRYIHNGEPMQLEVPADQYDRVVTLFADKIEAGLVPGVSDPAAAADIVRPGRLTYQQAINLTKPLTAESLAYDAATGAVVCLCAAGISFIAATVSGWYRTRSIAKSARSGFSAAAQGLGRTFGQHLLISQLARSDLAAAALPAATAVVDPLAADTVNALAGALRSLTGKAAVFGATAEKQLARMLRTGLLSSAAVFLLLAIPDVIRLITRRISVGQFARNLVCRLASLTGGTIGAIGAGLLLDASAAPALGTLAAMTGAFLGGTALAWGVSALIGLFHTDDATRTICRLNDTAVQMYREYNLSADEASALVLRLKRIPTRELRRDLMKLRRAKDQPHALRSFLLPHFSAVTGNRAPVPLNPRDMSLEMPDIG